MIQRLLCLPVLSYSSNNYPHIAAVEFENVLKTLRLSACDQLMILDCPFSAKAIGPGLLGNGKFELMASGSDSEWNSPFYFTGLFNSAMTHLLEQNAEGFSTPHLYREICLINSNPGLLPRPPLLLDQTRHYEKIWLQPQVRRTLSQSKKDGGSLKLTLKLNVELKVALKDGLVSQLKCLPHVDQIKLEDLEAPREQIADLKRFAMQAQKLRPLIRKMRARRQMRLVRSLKSANHVEKMKVERMKGLFSYRAKVDDDLST